MPWRAPDQAPVHPDVRLDPYRDRAGRLLRRNTTAATLYLRVELWWRQLGGHLWWRRWSGPMEIVHGFLLTGDSEFDDFMIAPEDLQDELMAWDRGRFIYRGESLRVQWLNDTESQRIREDVFGLDESSE